MGPEQMVTISQTDLTSLNMPIITNETRKIFSKSSKKLVKPYIKPQKKVRTNERMVNNTTLENEWIISIDEDVQELQGICLCMFYCTLNSYNVIKGPEFSLFSTNDMNSFIPSFTLEKVLLDTSQYIRGNI